MKQLAFFLVVVSCTLAVGKDPPVNPADFPLAVKVLSFVERTEDGGPVSTHCEDITIPGPYPKTTRCTTTGGSVTYQDTQLAIGTMAYTAHCECSPLSPGDYMGRWKDEQHLEILSPDAKGVLKVRRYRILAAKQIAQPATPLPTGLTPCSVVRATLDIASVPPGAEITVDGEFRGSTPSSLELSEGDHAILIQERGFKKWERHARITGGKITVMAELEKE